ncbi:NADH:flavin oxidoreductase (plasmid) [Rhizorhabdus wittichii]|uniref:NADH:flavin oxidoreductase n=1 Tax=Rhizorhabdus wittichii TaxID=160791 RepID=A0A975HH09_9SPHN|nr:NADH:flavin oxidoreductase [Rhizorhabdus wittichii]QTH25003.1 NADH:flavin oxidoreductase [Rhizorhabdus wittichii]
MRDLSILFEPVTVNGVTLPNRIAMAPMGRNFADDGVPPAGLADYFARRARGGVGLCIGEASRVDHPVASNDTLHTAFHGQDALGVWRTVVDAVHAEGGCFIPQIWHAGMLRSPVSDHPQIPSPHLPPVGPSGWAEPLVHTAGWVTPIREAAQIGEAMTDSDIADVIASFARATVEARDMGCDGVNIHGAHGYLIDQFFWTRTNLRDDDYGGDLLNRTRFAAELVSAARAAAGPDFPIFFRWSQWKQQDYHCKIAETPGELETFLRPLVDAGVDMFDCSTRRFWEPEFEGSALNLAGWTKKLTGKPTMTVGSVGLERANFADDAESSMSDSGLASLDPLIDRLEAGEFDLVGVGRMLITNPEWANQVREGRDHEIRPYSNTHLMALD